MFKRVRAGILVLTTLVGVLAIASNAAQAQEDSSPVSTADANEGAPSTLAAESRITAGYSHTCVVLDSGSVRCWGNGASGRLGYADTTSIGDNETLAGIGPVNLGTGRTAKSISAGANHTCAILDNATVRCWGDGLDGRLGYGNTNNIGDNETPGSVGPVNLGAGRTAKAITAGGSKHTCAILDNGTVRCWGNGSNGRLGYGNSQDIGDNEAPGSVGPVNLGAGRTAKAITAGSCHTCAILDNGTVRCWGRNNAGQLGYGDTNNIGDNEAPGSVGPVDLGAGRTAKAITAGSEHTCAILDNGTVRCWGNGANGRLGYGNTSTIGDDETPGSLGTVNLGAGRTAKAITAGADHTCAVLDNGSVRCWGSGTSGRLGYGNNSTIGDNEAPGAAGPVNLGVGRTAVGVTAGGLHNCAILDNGTVRCWGTASDGQLGYGNRIKIGDNEAPASAGPVAIVPLTFGAPPGPPPGGGNGNTDQDGDGNPDVDDPVDNRVNRIFVTNVIQSGPAEYDFLFGTAQEEIFTGDWDGNGHDGFARRSGRTIVEVNERGQNIRTFAFGPAMVSGRYRVGDWDGNGTSTFAIQNGNIFDVTNSPSAAGPTFKIGYGKAGDEVFVGDWDGNGTSTFAVRRGNVFYVRNSVTTGVADIVFGYGRAGDEVLVGDWNNDGIDTFAVRRGNVIYIRNDFQTGIAQTTIGYGKASDILLVGDWNGDNIDTFAVQRKELP